MYLILRNVYVLVNLLKKIILLFLFDLELRK